MSRSAHEEKQIALARSSAKLQVRDNRISALQEYRDKYRQMMNESPIPQRPSEPVIPPVAQNLEIPPVGLHPAGTNRFKRPPNSNDPDPPASDSGPPEGRRRWGGPPGGSDPDLKSRQGGCRIEFQTPRNLKLVTLLSPRCHPRQDVTYGDRRLEMQLQPHTNTILMPLTIGSLQWKSQLLRLI